MLISLQILRRHLGQASQIRHDGAIGQGPDLHWASAHSWSTWRWKDDDGQGFLSRTEKSERGCSYIDYRVQASKGYVFDITDQRYQLCLICCRKSSRKRRETLERQDRVSGRFPTGSDSFGRPRFFVRIRIDHGANHAWHFHAV